MLVLALISPVAAALAAQQPGVLDLVGGMRERAADLAAVSLGNAAGVRGALGGEGALHLGEQRQEQERDAAHALVCRVDRQRVGQGADGNAAPGEVVDEVEDVADVAAEPVQGVHDNHVGCGTPLPAPTRRAASRSGAWIPYGAAIMGVRQLAPARAEPAVPTPRR
jgi:hypothetical protein